MPRPLTQAEIDELLHGDHVARLATLDAAGYPHVTPLWFLWEQVVFHLASDTGRPHLPRIRANPRVGLVIDTEDPNDPTGNGPTGSSESSEPPSYITTPPANGPNGSGQSTGPDSPTWTPSPDDSTAATAPTS